MSHQRSELRQCPYDPNHKVLGTRFEAHLIRCSRNSYYDICPFNAQHHVKRNALRAHISACPDRMRLANEKVLSELSLGENYDVLDGASSIVTIPVSTNAFKDCLENWDDEIKDVKVPIIQPLRTKPFNKSDSYVCMKPAERKMARNEMLQKFKSNMQNVQEAI